MFTVFSTLIMAYSLNNMYLIWATRKYRDRNHAKLDSYPKVAIQLPVFNEKAVIKRLIESVLNLDWPSEQLDIQILDDSTDETSKIIDQISAKTPEIKVIRRENREGYKAGALQNGLEETDAEFIAIFDADFLPERDFLKQVVPILTEDDRIGLVQTRWGHINRGFNKLTKAISLALDWHHNIEQVGRDASNLIINYNGSCGVFRRKAIEEVGGWRTDTLSEDLDMSYRVQLGNWEAVYLRDVIVPGEIPPSIADYRIQQRRWAKGSIQCSRNLLGKVLKSDLGFRQKVQSILHLNGYSVYLWTVLILLLSVPAIILEGKAKVIGPIGAIGTIGVLSQMAIFSVLWKTNKRSIRGFIGEFLFLFITSIGLSIECSLAVIQGLFMRGGEFLRTPKYNLTSVDEWKLKPPGYSTALLPEILLALYSGIGLILTFLRADWGMLFYFILHALGFVTVILLSVKPDLF